jgi:hypothetical protein
MCPMYDMPATAARKVRNAYQRWLALRRLRSQLEQAQDFIATLEDQVVSGRLCLRQWESRRERIQARIYMIESADALVSGRGRGERLTRKAPAG